MGTSEQRTSRFLHRPELALLLCDTLYIQLLRLLRQLQVVRCNAAWPEAGRARQSARAPAGRGTLRSQMVILSGGLD